MPNFLTAEKNICLLLCILFYFIKVYNIKLNKPIQKIEKIKIKFVWIKIKVKHENTLKNMLTLCQIFLLQSHWIKIEN